jgi:hypothetical protein
MVGQQEHSWAAAILFRLTSAEAKQISSDPATIDDAAALAPRELVGPSTDCFVFLAEDAHHSSE